MEKVEQLKLPKKETKKEREKLGRMGMLILLLITSLISLGFYLKYKIGEVGINLPEVPEILIGGSEIITIEK